MQQLENTIKKNSWAFGAFIAIVSPFVALFVLHYFFHFLTSLMSLRPFHIERFYLLSLSANLLLMRYYLVNTKLVKTGKSILVVTFLLIIVFFVYYNP